MGRIQGIEIADLEATPASLKVYISEFLGFIGGLTGAPYVGFVERLAEVFGQRGITEVLELCAGHGGPSRQLQPMLKKRGHHVGWTLTDLRPPPPEDRALIEARAPGIRFADTSVDATHVPEELRGFRVVCNAFHHFPPELARAILEDAVTRGEGIAIMEVTARHPMHMLSVLFLPFNALLILPFMRPFRWSRLGWVLTGIGPFIGLFDGLVSCVRVYSPAELDALTEGLPGTWESGRAKMKGPGFVTYCIGLPE